MMKWCDEVLWLLKEALIVIHGCLTVRLLVTATSVRSHRLLAQKGCSLADLHKGCSPVWRGHSIRQVSETRPRNKHKLQTIADIPTFNNCSNNPATHTMAKTPHTHNNPICTLNTLFSCAQSSLSYMLSPRPYKPDPLCSALTYFSLCLRRILAPEVIHCAMPIHTTDSVHYWEPQRSAMCRNSTFQEHARFLMSGTCAAGSRLV